MTGPDATEGLIAAVAPELFEWVMGTNYRCERARLALLRLDDATFRRVLGPLVDAFVADDQRDAWDYAGVLSLVKRRPETGMAAQVLDAGSRSPDADIRVTARLERDERFPQ
ncbi:hypothetical protein [Amycolatopsis sp. WGS_07]|uniref:hypothetical protein n=1 Tax=Amycolatopsis sp. WGS_07 TaxID=3076764 RepID=UPI00387384DA